MQQRAFAFSTIIATVMLLSVGCSANLNSKAPWVWERDPNSDDWSEELDLVTLESKPALVPNPPLILHRGDSVAKLATDRRAWRCRASYSPMAGANDWDHESLRPKTRPHFDGQVITTDSIWQAISAIPFAPATRHRHPRVKSRWAWQARGSQASLGLHTSYSHLSKIFVRPGDPIAKGQPIGELEQRASNRPHLHFELHHNGHHLDPLNF